MFHYHVIVIVALSLMTTASFATGIYILGLGHQPTCADSNTDPRMCPPHQTPLWSTVCSYSAFAISALSATALFALMLAGPAAPNTPHYVPIVTITTTTQSGG